MQHPKHWEAHGHSPEWDSSLAVLSGELLKIPLRAAWIDHAKLRVRRSWVMTDDESTVQ